MSIFSKFNLNKIKTAAIKSDLATMDTSDAELEQLCLNALVSHAAKSTEDEDEPEKEDLHKTDGKEPKKTATTEGSKTDEKTDEKAEEAPAWFKAFEKKTEDQFTKVHADLKVVAKKPQSSTTDTAKGTHSTKRAEDAPLWMQNPKNKAHLEAWLVE